MKSAALAGVLLMLCGVLCACGKINEPTNTDTAESSASSDAESQSDSGSESGADSQDDGDSGNPDGDSAETPEASQNEGGTADSSAEDDVPFEIGDEMTFGVNPVTAKAGDKAVPVDICVWNNTEFFSGGIKIFYDSALTPVQTGESSPISSVPEAKCKLGDVMNGFMYSCLIGEEEHIVACGFMSTEATSADGTLYTIYFDVPDDAESGTRYKFVCDIDSLNSPTQRGIAAKTVTGTLTVE